MKLTLLGTLIAGWTLRSAAESAKDGDATFAVILLALGLANLSLAILRTAMRARAA